MKLNKEHKEILLTWIAEGLQSNEINERAGLFSSPFDVSKTQVAYYRETRHDKITELKAEYENSALNRGLARKCIRVQKLQKLAALLEKDLFDDGLLWTQHSKTVAGERHDYLEFNKGEVAELRGLYDDIAKELGHRVTNNRIEQSIDLDKLTVEQLERLAAGEDILKVLAG